MKLSSLAPMDWIALLIGVLALGGLTTVVAMGDGGAGTQVGIRAGDTDHRYPLDQDRTLEFDGPLGTTRVHISDGGVEVLSDPGPQQICVRQGRISEPSQWLACLPNEVFIRIYGETDSAPVDGQTY